jgi:hypothetical protein
MAIQRQQYLVAMAIQSSQSVTTVRVAETSQRNPTPSCTGLVFEIYSEGYFRVQECECHFFIKCAPPLGRINQKEEQDIYDGS